MMVKITRQVDASRVLELFTYNPRTGVFRHRKNAGQGGRYPAGTIAGSRNVEGYWMLTIDGKQYNASRVAWCYMVGAWPQVIVDHENGVVDDNRWDNLRLATDKQSAHNRILPNKHGVRGVSKKRNLWRARIMVDGKSQHIGYYPTKEEAHAAYVRKAREIHGDFFAD